MVKDIENGQKRVLPASNWFLSGLNLNFQNVPGSYRKNGDNVSYENILPGFYPVTCMEIAQVGPATTRLLAADRDFISEPN